MQQRTVDMKRPPGSFLLERVGQHERRDATGKPPHRKRGGVIMVVMVMATRRRSDGGLTRLGGWWSRV
jgi:hypothetical protein